MPLQATSGAASYDAFGGGAAAVPNYIEEVFSTYLYTGTGASKTITNGIDLSTKGGLVWIKGRSGATGHRLTDTARGATKSLASETTAAEATETTGLTAFGTTGFTIGADADYNTSAATYASWTFRKQPKFFDIVTYTGNSVLGREIPHNLGSTPAVMIVKRTDITGDWAVYHSSLGVSYNLQLNSTAAAVFTASTARWNNTAPTATVFTVGNGNLTNNSGNTYVAYLFASNAGGFGLTGTENVISCGSYTGNGSATGPVVTLGYEPQWLMIKKSSGTGNWQMIDNMRGMPVGSADATLQANLTDAETSVEYLSPTATGFQITSTNTEVNTSAATYIYIAIRRGPMKVPTTGTSVFGLNARTGSDVNVTVTGGQTDDAILVKGRDATSESLLASRLTGISYFVTSAASAELSAGTTILQANPWDVMDGVKVGTTGAVINSSPTLYINYLFKRAPSFMDVVCYTGTGANTTQTHNLNVVPELIICKRRDTTGAWDSYSSALANTEYIVLNTTAAKATGATRWNNTTPTSSVFSLGTSTTVNASAGTYIAYLFATCAGVSKVGSYTGNGSTQTIDCGITAGVRFVLIKRTDAVGSWYVYDTARGMTLLTDPYWLTNSTAAEVATLGSVTTVATGFAVDSTILAAINVNAGTYIFLAIG